MYLIIDSTTYTTWRELSFAPETDLTGSAMPINQFSVQIITDDDIAFGQYAELYDDRNTLWAKYWITYAERVNPKAVEIRAQSDLRLLDGVTLPAVMYDEEPIADVLASVMVSQSGAPGVVATVDYSLDESFDGATISGFCPEQTARQRLQWVCFAIGAYVKTFFTDEIEILPIDTTAEIIPMSKTMLQPTLTKKDYVTAVKVKAYTFTEGTPQTTDTWVTDGTDYYIVTDQEYTLANPSAPSSAPDNVVTIDKVYLINADNVAGILSRLAAMHFKRTEVEADVIDNADYIPGDTVTVYTDDSSMITGAIRSADFAFGLQARARLKLTGAETIEGAKLTINSTYDGMPIDSSGYWFPVGYVYSVQMLYVDMELNGHRYILRPETATVTGTMTSAGATVEVEYAVALDYFEGVLDVISVDALSQSEGAVTIT